jgi:hypothetical protein
MQHEAARTTGRGAFAPGEAFQFDRSEDWAVIGGESTRLQVAPFKLSQSRAFLLRAYSLQTHEMLFDACNHAFAVLGGDLEDMNLVSFVLGQVCVGHLATSTWRLMRQNAHAF